MNYCVLQFQGITMDTDSLQGVEKRLQDLEAATLEVDGEAEGEQQQMEMARRRAEIVFNEKHNSDWRWGSIYRCTAKSSLCTLTKHTMFTD